MTDNIDPLTGLPTYLGLPTSLDTATAAVFLDIDGLRFLNDELGHLAVDRMLTSLGGWLGKEAETLRGRVFRVAGDEFILLLPGRTLDEAEAIANRIVSTCPSLKPQHAEPARGEAMTLSAVVFIADSELPRRLHMALDEFAEKLYRTEVTAGRNRRNVISIGRP